MRNKNKIILYIFLFIIFNNSSISDEFKVKSNTINVTDEGNIINAIGDVEVESNNNLIILSDRSILDKKKSLVISSGNVFLTDKTNDLKIKSDEIKFSRSENKATISGNSKVIFEDNYTLSSDKVIYDKNNNSVYSNERSILLDKKGNKVKLSKFDLDLNTKKAKVFNLDLTDINKNNFILKEAFVDLENGQIEGKDLKLFFNKSILGNVENDPRIFGSSVINNKNETIVNKGVFTSCKLNEKEKCPPWEMKADEIKHDKKNKILEYKNAFLKVYDKPVLYFPYFYHPDPSVKRQSGFLMPKTNNSSFLGS